jgi:predicted transcriptional regulator
MPDDTVPSIHVSLRVPQDVAEAFDRMAAILERPRSWLILRALRHYMKAEGAELLDDIEAITELDRGKGVPSEQVLAEMDGIIKRRKVKRVRKR